MYSVPPNFKTKKFPNPCKLLREANIHGTIQVHVAKQEKESYWGGHNISRSSTILVEQNCISPYLKLVTFFPPTALTRNFNLLVTQRDCRTKEYWPKVMTV